LPISIDHRSKRPLLVKVARYAVTLGAGSLAPFG
jgi:hypothetical protein